MRNLFAAITADYGYTNNDATNVRTINERNDERYSTMKKTTTVFGPINPNHFQFADAGNVRIVDNAQPRCTNQGMKSNSFSMIKQATVAEIVEAQS